MERVSIVHSGDPVTSAGSQSVVLALNSGSSSLKFGLYRVTGSRTEELLSGAAEAIGEPNGKFHATIRKGAR